jgi:hypothetical protein
MRKCWRALLAAMRSKSTAIDRIAARALIDGVVAGVLLKRSNAENSGWIVVAGGWAFAVLCGIFTALLFGSNDGHLNPAIISHA